MRIKLGVLSIRYFDKYIVGLFVFALSVLLANRPPGMDNDYSSYLYIFGNSDVPVELGFRLLSNVFVSFQDGFVIFLFLITFAGLWLKVLVLYRERASGRYFDVAYISMVYLVFFLPVWEMTQIRSALAIGLVFCALQQRSRLGVLLYFIVGLLFHNLVLIFMVLWFFYEISGRYRYFFGVGACFLVLFGYGVSGYADVYSVDVYSEVFNPVSFKNLFIVVGLFVLIGFLDSYGMHGAVKYFAVSIFSLYFIFGLISPSIAIRLADIALFFIFVGLAMISVRAIVVYRYLSFLFVAPYFVYIYFFGANPVINLSVL